MPPEPLPWDQKDFFKERKHERPKPHHHHHHHPHYPIGGGGGYGGVGGFGGGPRWREPPNPHPHPYHYASPRRVSDFRYRPPPGYGKQGGRHLYPEESSHRFVPTRPSERMFDDESCRASGSGKYSRNNRDNRGPFGHKDWKGQAWDVTPTPNGPGRPNGTVDQQRSVDDVLTWAPSQPHLDSVNSWDPSLFKEQHEKSSDFKDLHEKSSDVNAMGSSGQRLERENSLGSIDWKPLKWTRSGSLSSRGSGFSHSSSSKSMGADSNELKAEVQLSNLTPVQSPSRDAAMAAAAPLAMCEISAAPSEETSSRKKPRLGWGEGLAKFEKKKVDGVDDTATKNGILLCSSTREPLHLHSSILADKSPRITGFSDCTSPATPSSVGCSSSPGVEEKQFIKAGHVDQYTSNLSLSPGIVSQNHVEEGSIFNLENLDLTHSSHMDSAINHLLQSDDPSTVDSGYVKSTAINKLLVWKDDVLKKLEMTECEIDRVEGELKSLTVLESSCPRPSVSNCLPVDSLSIPTQEQDATSNTTHRPAPLELVSPGDSNREKMTDTQEGDHAEVKDDDVDSPGSATSKFVEVRLLGKDVSPSESEAVIEVLDTNMDKSVKLELRCLGDGVHEEKEAEISTCSDGSQLISSSPTRLDEFYLCDAGHNLCESIFASNRDSANRAAEVFNKLLPTGLCTFNISNVSSVSSLESNPIVQQKYLRRKQLLQIKERLISLKFRALQYLWKEEVRSLSARKFRRPHRKLHLLRTVCSTSQKHRSSNRSRYSSTDKPILGNLNSEPNKEMLNLLSKLLSDSQVKPCRNTLKMPALILDEKEKLVSRFISSNGMVEDPFAVEKERSIINPWTSEEREIFMDKLTVYGKNFTKIASFLAHKTTADCIEFYYKNHKSDCFKKTKKHPDFSKQGKMHSANNYLVASGKRWNREANAASLDILGAASAIAAKADNDMEIQHKFTSKYLIRRSSDHKTSGGDNGLLERSSSLDIDSNERETVAADVLAGICGSLSSEAMSSCITSAVDRGEGYHEWKSQRVGLLSRWPLTPEVVQNVDDETCSDESCGEMDHTDWTDEEKAIFIQAVSSFGKDFTVISRYMNNRSRDECKVFFSKARKCLGLDMICPGSGNVVRDNVDGGGSDTDDACPVETGSVICSEKSGVKMEVDFPSSEMLFNSEPHLAGITTVKPDLNQSDENNATGDQDSVDTQLLSKNLLDESQMGNKPEQELNGDGEIRTCPSSVPVAVQNQGSVGIPTGEAAQGGETCDHVNQSDAQDDSRAVDKHADRLDEESSGLSPVSLGSSINDRKEIDDASGLGKDLKSTQQVSANSCNVASVVDRSLLCDGVSGNQQLAQLELGTSGVSVSAQKPCVIPLQQNGFPVPMNLVPQVSAIECGEVPNKGTSSFPRVAKINGEQGLQATRAGQKFLSGSSLLGNFDSSQVLINYPVSASSVGEVNGESTCRRSVTFQSNPKLDKNVHHDQQLARDSFLRKCNGMKNQSLVSELQFKALEHLRDSNYSYQSGSSSAPEKPRRNGDVKLFGQILTKPSSQQKLSSSTQQSGDNENQHSSIGKPFSPRFAGDQASGTTSQTKLDRHNLLGSENRPLRRYWDGGRIQTGFNSLPDSAMLLAKYPDAFGNYAMPSSKIEQLPVNRMSSGERGLNGVAVFPARESSGSNAVADYQAYRSRELQRQDVVLSEMQRRNGFDAVSGLQQQARGMVGMNVRRGILVGGQCTGVSDPVAAMKMHYSNANAEQLNGGHAGGIIREDDSWRGKGNIGR